MTSRWNIKIINAYIKKFTPKNANRQNNSNMQVDDLFMEKSLERESGNQIGLITKNYIDSENVIQGFIETLGDEGMRKIFDKYATESLDGINGDVAISNTDAVIDIVRGVQLIEDINFQLFMKRLENEEKTDEDVKLLRDICGKIILQKKKKKK